LLQIPRYGAAEAIGKSSDGFADPGAEGRETEFGEPDGCAARICGQIGAYVEIQRVAIKRRDDGAAQEVAATFPE
jgi:hypothetical protein